VPAVHEQELKKKLEEAWQSGGAGREALREELDGLEGYTLQQRIDRSLNSFFVGTLEPEQGVYESVDVDSIWTSDGFTCPAGYVEVAVYTRRMFKYPVVEFKAVLPSLPLPEGVSCFLGMQHGDATHLPMLWFELIGSRAAFMCYAPVSGSVYVEDLLPSDYDTARHSYAIKLNKCNAEFFIDGELKAISLLGVPNGVPTYHNAQPYALRAVQASGEYACAVPAGMAVKTPKELEYTFPLPANKEYFIYAPGDPMPPRQFPVYTENSETKWSNLATGGVTVTSHPIPIWGYPRKTVYFMSDAAGTLNIQAYLGGGWKTYDSITVAANSLEVYPFPAEVQIPIIRLVYEPTNDDTIIFAEVDMS